MAPSKNGEVTPAVTSDPDAHSGDRPIRVAFALVTYFDHGGLQRDCIRIARELTRRGLAVDVLVGRSKGPAPEGVSFRVLGARGRTNHARNLNFSRCVNACFDAHSYDVVVGFDPMPGLDVYFAGQPVYKAYAASHYGRLYRLSARYRARVALEASVACPKGGCMILALTKTMIEEFQAHYGTPAACFRLLKPTLGESFRITRDRAADRRSVRVEFGAQPEAPVCLFVGSRFRTKGLDRAVRAFADYCLRTDRDGILLVVGDDDGRTKIRLARRLDVGHRVHFLGGRDDVARLMTAADLLIHPARQEATGGVLIEAMATGLPILCSALCGYAEHVIQANAGHLLSEPFSQAALNETLARMLASQDRQRWSINAMAYTKTAVPEGWRADAVGFIHSLAQSRRESNG